VYGVLVDSPLELAWRESLRRLMEGEWHHLGAMAGPVDIVLRCLTEMRARDPVLRFDPALPPQVKQLRFSVHYRGHRIDVELAEAHMAVSSRPGGAPSIKVLVSDQTVELAPSQQRDVLLERKPYATLQPRQEPRQPALSPPPKTGAACRHSRSGSFARS
jgi:hypothetical protein